MHMHMHGWMLYIYIYCIKSVCYLFQLSLIPIFFVLQLTVCEIYVYYSYVKQQIATMAQQNDIIMPAVLICTCTNVFQRFVSFYILSVVMFFVPKIHNQSRSFWICCCAVVHMTCCNCGQDEVLS